MARSKTETIEEFLARGGSITKLNPKELPAQVEVIRKTIAGGPAVIMTLDEADLFYGVPTKNPKPKSIKPSTKIDLNALPEALRIKFINKLKEEAANGEDYEEYQEEEFEGDDDSDESED